MEKIMTMNKATDYRKIKESDESESITKRKTYFPLAPAKTLNLLNFNLWKWKEMSDISQFYDKYIYYAKIIQMTFNSNEPVK